MPQSLGYPPSNPANPNPLVLAFVRSASRLEHVRKILVEAEESGALQIWTVISAPPDEFSYREQVYRAEMVASDAAPGVLAEFRLVNVKELHASLNHLIPADCKIAYERHAP